MLAAANIRKRIGWLLTAVLLLVAIPVQQGRAASPQQVDVLIGQAKSAMVSDPEQALKLAQQAERESQTITDARDRGISLATALWLQSEARLRGGDGAGVATLIDRAMIAIRSIREPIKLRGDLLLTRGGLEIEQSLPAEALASFQEAHRLFQQAGEQRGQALALQNIAVLYTNAGDFERADRYYRNAGEVYEGDAGYRLFLGVNRGALLIQMEHYREAITELDEAMILARATGSVSLGTTIAANLARAYLDLDQLDNASGAIRLGRTLVESAAPGQSDPKLDTVEAQLELRRGRPAAAAALITRVFDGVDLSTTPVPLRDSHFTAYSIYSALGNAPLALRHLAAERRLEDQATKVAISTNAALMAARFDFANQELRIANLKAEELRRNIAFEREQARTERMVFVGLGVATVIVLALLSFGLFTIRRSRNQVRDANIVLADTNIALERALRAKTEFLATTSHEIRTPLNGILGMTQVMLADARIDMTMRDRIGVVHGAGLTMRSLVDDILDVAKMETGNLTVELATINLPATIRDVCRMWEEQARAKGIGFAIDVDDAPQWVESDPARLRQIVFNLLSNAIKFTSEGAVSVAVRRVGAMLHIAVCDSGIGIPADRQTEIFESFKQVDAGTTRQFGGTGLGLTICRNLAIALGGDVTVESTPGEGATFTVALHYRPGQAMPGSPVILDEGCALGVLDRNPIARSMLKAVLEPRCGSVCFVASIAELLALIDEGCVDRILIDEATLAAQGGDAIAMLRDIVMRADAANVTSSVLWPRPDPAVADALTATGIGQIIAKPIAGAALAERLAPRSVASGKDRLVSQAA